MNKIARGREQLAGNAKPGLTTREATKSRAKAQVHFFVNLRTFSWPFPLPAALALRLARETFQLGMRNREVAAKWMRCCRMNPRYAAPQLKMHRRFQSLPLASWCKMPEFCTTKACFQDRGCKQDFVWQLALGHCVIPRQPTPRTSFSRVAFEMPSAAEDRQRPNEKADRRQINKKRTRLALRGCQPGPPVKRAVSQAMHDSCRRRFDGLQGAGSAVRGQLLSLVV
jgi:hypothetical protein